VSIEKAIANFTLLLAGAAPLAAGDPPLPPALAPFFRPPPELAGDLGDYRSPLRFDDGRSVESAADWALRRREILSTWHAILGAWPPLLENPRVERLAEERRDGFLELRVTVEVAPQRTMDGYLLIPDGKPPFPAVVVVYYEAETGIGRGQERRDFALQLARRGFVALSVGTPASFYYPGREDAQLQPLSAMAYAAANCWQALAALPEVDRERIGIAGHSYGGKWAMFASCLFERFACAAWSDGGIVFDESRPNVNYWEPWYLGYERGVERRRGVPSPDNPRTGAYKRLVEDGRDLHELHALMAPRPFLVSGGSEDRAERWKALQHTIAVNRLLGVSERVALTTREGHTPTDESNEQLYLFFEHFLKRSPRAESSTGKRLRL
jgi:dipeptidyl aminopeptidase/acylaminoacyl peptidase